MRKSVILGSAAIALALMPLAFVQSSGAQSQFSQTSEAMSIDSRGILTMAPLLERVTPAVVSINTVGEVQPIGDSPEDDLLGRLFRDQLPQRPSPRSGLGSGVIVDAEKGLILTNHHVIDKSSEIRVTLEDKRELKAEVVGTDPQTDIALLKIKADDLTALKLAATNEAKVGDFVIAVGNPFGLSSTVTSGIISALGRDQRSSADGYADFIQTDASINPGNSGGALVNSKGELIGINSAIITRSGGNQGIGFAVPIRIVKGVMKQLEAYGEVRRGRIGVVIQDITPDLRQALNLGSLNGALISDVGEDTPAEKAGLEPQDVVVEFNGDDILDSADLRNAVGLLEPGARANITYMRNGKRRTSRIEVAEVDADDASRSGSSSVQEDDAPMLESFDGASITEIPEDLELRGGDKGVYVASVERNSTAARSGLRRGDIIRRVGSKSVSDLAAFKDAVKDKDGPFALSIERGGSNLFLAVK